MAPVTRMNYYETIIQSLQDTLTKKYTNILCNIYFPIMLSKESTIYKRQKHFHGAIKTPYQAILIKAEIRHYIYISLTKKAVLLLYGYLPVNVSGPLRLQSENQCIIASYKKKLFKMEN
jgi:hypothetical protein